MLVAGAAVSVPLAESHAVLPSHAPGWSLRSGPLGTCPGGERNALEAECLAAISTAAGKSRQGPVLGLTRVQSKTAPAGCSYNVDTETAVFNSEAAGRGHAGYHLACRAVSEIQLWRWPWEPEQEEQEAKAQQEEQAQQEEEAQQEEQAQARAQAQALQPSPGPMQQQRQQQSQQTRQEDPPPPELPSPSPLADGSEPLPLPALGSGQASPSTLKGGAPLSIIMVMGQSNVEPGHGDISMLTHGTRQRIRHVADRAEVCGRHCTQVRVAQCPRCPMPPEPIAHNAV